MSFIPLAEERTGFLGRWFICSEVNLSVDDLTRPQGCHNLHGRRIWGSIYCCPNVLNFITHSSALHGWGWKCGGWHQLWIDIKFPVQGSFLEWLLHTRASILVRLLALRLGCKGSGGNVNHIVLQLKWEDEDIELPQSSSQVWFLDDPLCCVMICWGRSLQS